MAVVQKVSLCVYHTTDTKDKISVYNIGLARYNQVWCSVWIHRCQCGKFCPFNNFLF